MCPINTYIKAVRERKKLSFRRYNSNFESDFFEYDVQASAIPLPIMTICSIYNEFRYVFNKREAIDLKVKHLRLCFKYSRGKQTVLKLYRTDSIRLLCFLKLQVV
jgi:hypothetical protein